MTYPDSVDASLEQITANDDIRSCWSCKWNDGSYCTRPDVLIFQTNRLARTIKQATLTHDGKPACVHIAERKVINREFLANRKSWLSEKQAAGERWKRSRAEYFERTGKAEAYRKRGEEYQKFLKTKEAAAEADREAYRLKGDNRIKEALAGACVPYGHDPDKAELSRAERDIASVVIDLCSGSGVLFASAATIGRMAKRSRRAVNTLLARLESLKILQRLSSGGIRLATGERRSNRYRLRYEALRDFLGITWLPEIDDPSENLNTRKAFWNSNGFCRFSNTDRADRRRRQREHEASLEAVKNPPEKALASEVKEADPAEKSPVYQVFCTLSISKDKKSTIKTPSEAHFVKNLYIFQPESLMHIKTKPHDSKTSCKTHVLPLSLELLRNEMRAFLSKTLTIVYTLWLKRRRKPSPFARRFPRRAEIDNHFPRLRCVLEALFSRAKRL